MTWRRIFLLASVLLSLLATNAVGCVQQWNGGTDSIPATQGQQ